MRHLPISQPRSAIKCTLLTVAMSVGLLVPDLPRQEQPTLAVNVRVLFLDGEPAAPGLDAEDLPAAGEKVPDSVFWIDDVKTTGK